MMPVCTTMLGCPTPRSPVDWWQGQSFEGGLSCVYDGRSSAGVYAGAWGVGKGPVTLLLADRLSTSAPPFWSIVVLLAVLNFRWAAGLGAWAAAVTRKPWLQGFCFAPADPAAALAGAPATGHPRPPHLAQLRSVDPRMGQLVCGLGQGAAAGSRLRNVCALGGLRPHQEISPVVAMVVGLIAAHAGTGGLRAAPGHRPDVQSL